MRATIIATALLAASCAQPVVTGASRDEVVIKYDPLLKSPGELQPQADSECGRYGRRAALRDGDRPMTDGFRHARFECR